MSEVLIQGIVTAVCRTRSFRMCDKQKVLISISSLDIDVYDREHSEDDWFDVLKIDFDDVSSEEEAGDWFFLMTPDQADIIRKFIEKHRGRDFIVHCDAGISRSVAVAAYMRDYHKYESCFYETGFEADRYKNIHVYNLLRGRESVFGEIET